MKVNKNLERLKALRTLKTLMVLMAVCLFAGCSEDDNLPNGTGEALTIQVSAQGFTSGSPETRTTDAGYTTSFAPGDQIGITVIQDGVIRENNIPYEYGGTSWNPVAAPADIYTAGTVTYLVYYPYSAAMNGKTSAADIVAAFTPKTDQSAPADYAASDLLTGTGSLTGSTLTATLTHALALIEVSLPASATAVTLKAGTTDVTPYKIGDGYRYIAKPQTGVTLSGGYTWFGATLTWQKTSVTLTAGQYTKIEAKAAIFDIRDIPVAFITAGTFMMGSPSTEPNRYSDETQHPVTLTKDFYMGKYPVTNAQYAAFLNANTIGSDGKWASGTYPAEILIKTSSSGSYNWGLNWDGVNNKWVPASGYDNHPVIYVTWYGADEYARWAGGSLPTEAQWEYACRGDYPNKATEVNTLPFGIGTGRKLTGDMANFRATRPYDLDHNPSGDYNDELQSSLYKGGTTAVGAYPYANNYGLYDMHGNVREWCLDQWNGSDNYSTLPPTDPVCTLGSFRVLRGGDWNSSAQNCRSAYRNGDYPDFANSVIGFRVVFVP